MRALLWWNLWTLGVGLVGLAALLALFHGIERWSGRYVARRLGWRAVVLTGWIGVPVHELGHLLMARLFQHRIVAWKLFDPDPVTGTLGYVRHAHSRPTSWQIAGNFFIGVAPLLGGGGILLLLLGWMLPAEQLPKLIDRAYDLGGALASPSVSAVLAELGAALWALGSSLWDGRTPWLPLQLYLCVCVASHLAPSIPDLRSSAAGCAITVAGLAGVTIVVSAFDISIAPGLTLLLPLGALLVLVALFQGTYVALVALTTRLSRRKVVHTRPTEMASLDT